MRRANITYGIYPQRPRLDRVEIIPMPQRCRPIPTLLLTLLCVTALLPAMGCAQEAPYTEQTAEIDPAMNDTPDNHTDSDTPDGLEPDAQGKVSLTDTQWRALLSEEEFYVLRRSGTERPGTGRYLKLGKEDEGAYHERRPRRQPSFEKAVECSAEEELFGNWRYDNGEDAK